MTARATDSKGLSAKVTTAVTALMGVVAAVTVAAYASYFGSQSVAYAATSGDTVPLLGVLGSLFVVFVGWNTASHIREAR